MTVLGRICIKGVKRNMLDSMQCYLLSFDILFIIKKCSSCKRTNAQNLKNCMISIFFIFQKSCLNILEKVTPILC